MRPASPLHQSKPRSAPFSRPRPMRRFHLMIELRFQSCSCDTVMISKYLFILHYIQFVCTHHCCILFASKPFGIFCFFCVLFFLFFLFFPFLFPLFSSYITHHHPENPSRFFSRYRHCRDTLCLGSFSRAFRTCARCCLRSCSYVTIVGALPMQTVHL